MWNARKLVLIFAISCAGSDDVKPISDVNCTDDKCDGNAVVPGVAETRVFPQLTFSFPVQMVFSPGDSHRAFVVEHSGKVRAFDTQNADHADTVLDLNGKLKMNAPPHFEAGLNAIALDPGFPGTPVMYVTYDAINPSDPNNPTRLRWRLSRFTSRNGGATFDSNS